MTRLEIIQETVDYYSDDVSKRSIDDTGQCLYFSPNGNRCPLGRYCKEGEEEVLKSYENDGAWNVCGSDSVILKFYPHDREFWSALQDLHDCEDNWDDKGLTLQGENEVEKLKIDYRQ